MDKERERSLLALLEWEERVEAWLRIPAPGQGSAGEEACGADGPAGGPGGEVR